MGVSVESNSPTFYKDEADFSFRPDPESSLEVTIHATHQALRKPWEVTVEMKGEGLLDKKVIKLTSPLGAELAIGFLNPDTHRPHVKIYNFFELLGPKHPFTQKFQGKGEAIFCTLRVVSGQLEVRLT